MSVFHPLAKFPGPKLWAMSRFPYVLSLYRGNLVHDTLAMHGRYGPIVRIAPNELSFTDPDACRDIYNKRQGHLSFRKNQTWVPTPPKKGPQAPSILNADDEDYARIRKAWSYSFSDKALKDQEATVTSHVDKLISKLHSRIDPKSGYYDVDIVKWYNYCAFDIVGDLAFGESFGCLDRDEYHDSVAMIIHHFKAAIMMTASKYYPWFHKLMSKKISKESIIKQKNYFAFAKQQVRKRLDSEKERPDFVSQLSKSQQGLSDQEIIATASIIIIAGSNSLTTTLSGTTNYLLRNPQVLDTLKDELRLSFKKECDMTVQALQQLPYLNAVIEEGLRMITPVPLGMVRDVPKGGDTVCGHFLPEGVSSSFPRHYTKSTVLIALFPDQRIIHVLRRKSLSTELQQSRHFQPPTLARCEYQVLSGDQRAEPSRGFTAV
jgi:cytochrome P450